MKAFPVRSTSRKTSCSRLSKGLRCLMDWRRWRMRESIILILVITGLLTRSVITNMVDDPGPWRGDGPRQRALYKEDSHAVRVPLASAVHRGDGGRVLQ